MVLTPNQGSEERLFQTQMPAISRGISSWGPVKGPAQLQTMYPVGMFLSKNVLS